MQCASAFLCFLGITYVGGTTLSWSNTYSYEAVLYVPFADIKIPIRAWLDTSGRTRVDFYNGLVKLYRLRLYGSAQDFVFFKIYPETKTTDINGEVCRKLSPDDDEVLQVFEVISYLPSYDFEYKGSEQLNGFECQKWEYITTSHISGYKVIFSNTIWVTYEVVGNEVVAVPVRYKHKSTKENITLDYFIHEYVKFSVNEIDSAIFDLPDEVLCTDQQDEDEIEYSEQFKYEHHRTTRAEKRLMKTYLIKSKSNALTYLVESINDFIKFLESILGNRANISNENYDRIHENSEENGIFSIYNMHFDWRDFGAISKVKDQTSMCSSSYAFAAAAAMESTIFLGNGFGAKREISAQAIIDCSWRETVDGNYGCRGGSLKATLHWIQQHGIPFDDEYGPYLAMEGLCHASSMAKLAHINNYYKVKKDIDTIKRVLRNRGPLLVAVDGSLKSFRYYSKGIYKDKECARKSKFESHILLLVGYGQEKGEDYWILKNSYGTSWGEKGYIRIAIQNNTCGVMNNVYSIKL